MLRHRMPEPYIWIMVWFLLAMILLLVANTLTTQPALAAVSQIEDAHGCVLYYSQQRLPDQTEKPWQVMLFKQVQPDQDPSLYLRLMGLPGASEVAHPMPLTITTEAGSRLMAPDMFLDDPPLPTVGQYNVKELAVQLPTDDLVLTIPLMGHHTVTLPVPRSVVQEWESIITQPLAS